MQRWPKHEDMQRGLDETAREDPALSMSNRDHSNIAPPLRSRKATVEDLRSEDKLEKTASSESQAPMASTLKDHNPRRTQSYRRDAHSNSVYADSHTVERARVQASAASDHFHHLEIDSRDDQDTATPKTMHKLSTVSVPALCKDCKNLQISRESFVISRSNARHDADTTSSIGTSQIPPRTSHLRSGKGTQKLPNFNIIQARATSCNMCKLISMAIDPKDMLGNSADHVTCSVCWEVDGHDQRRYLPGSDRHFRLMSFSNRTRRLRLAWTTISGTKKEAFIVVVADKAVEPARAIARKRVESMFQSREIGIDEGRQTMIKGWLDGCHNSKSHDVCRQDVTIQQEFRDICRESYFGVIDVIALQLVQLPLDHEGKPAHYVALSYVWGNTNQRTSTKKENVNERRQPGGLESILRDLPKAIRDSISLVQRLGMRYLWVDALCIVQNNATSFMLNANIMHSIYGNALFTICAADGENADSGLVALSHQAEGRRPVQAIVEVLPGLRLQAVRPPEIVIRDSIWDTRGWTFQERILSRKCVVFAEGKVFFQCRRAALSEEIHNDITGSEWSLQSIGSPMHYLPEIQMRAASFFLKAVPLYSKRNLTESADILAAFRGVESLLEKVLCAPFVFGIPTSHFDLGLLWQPLSSMKRRVGPKHVHTGRCKPGEDGKYHCRPTDNFAKGQVFPSWSWCGWESEGRDSQGIGYDIDMLAGVTANVEQWLRKRTWIRWRICDGKGRLRPLWDRRYAEDDMSTDEVWRGYTGRPHSDMAFETGTTDAKGWDSASSEHSDEMVDKRITEPSTGYDFLARKRQKNFYLVNRDHDRSGAMHTDEYYPPPRADYGAEPAYDAFAPPPTSYDREILETMAYRGPNQRQMPTRWLNGREAIAAIRARYSTGKEPVLDRVSEEDNELSDRYRLQYELRLLREREGVRDFSEQPRFNATTRSYGVPGELPYRYAEVAQEGLPPVSHSFDRQPSIRNDNIPPVYIPDEVNNQTGLPSTRPLAFQTQESPFAVPGLSVPRDRSNVRFRLNPDVYPIQPDATPQFRPRRRSRSYSRKRSQSYDNYYDGRPGRRNEHEASFLDGAYATGDHEDNELWSDPDSDLDRWGREKRDRDGKKTYTTHQLRTINIFKEPHFEHPYGIATTRFEPLRERSQHMTDLPILRFWTFKTTLRVLPPTTDNNVSSSTGLSTCDISDSAGDWCGFIVVNTSWIMSRDRQDAQFIAISEAKAFTQQELKEWSFYSPRPRVDSDWEVYYALLVEYNKDKQVYERIGLAKVFKDAFNDGPWQEILLG